mgnify:CR=1 FL=1
MNRLLRRLAAASACTLAVSAAWAQNTVNAICSTDQSWCELAAKEFTQATGITVQQTRKATGEALAQLRAESANPKTDIWWGGTGDPFLQAAELGLLAPYRPAYINDLHGWSVRQYAMSGNMVVEFLGKLLPVVVITVRELAISVFRVFVGAKGVSVPASKLAKLKTLTQQFAVGDAGAGEEDLAARREVYRVAIKRRIEETFFDTNVILWVFWIRHKTKPFSCCFYNTC